MQKTSKGKVKMSILLILIIYIFMSSTGLLLIKMGTADTAIGVQNGVFDFKISLKMIIGFIVYVCSFLLSVYLLSRMDVSLFYPIGTGSIIALSCIFGYFVLKEQISTYQIIGIVLILGGIVFMNIKR